MFQECRTDSRRLSLRSFLREQAIPEVVPDGTEPSMLKTGVDWPETNPGPAAAERGNFADNRI
jgi:hypothetical protein